MASWNTAFGGVAKSHGTALLEQGIHRKPMGMTNEDSQFLETRKYQVNEIARIFRLQPHMIGDLDKATFANIEHQGIEFVTHTIRPWLVRWEQAISRDLIWEPERYFVEFNVEGLLRGDTKARYEAHALAIQNGWMTRNEVRIIEGRNPMDGLDEFLQPMNMAGAGERPTETATQMTALINDVADRIASAEIRTISQRMEKAEDDRERFNAWVCQYFAKHGEYVGKTIGPLCKTINPKADRQSIVRAICDGAQEEILAVDNVVTMIAYWASRRTNEIVAIITERLYDEILSDTQSIAQ